MLAPAPTTEPARLPLRYTPYPATPTLSLDGCHVAISDVALPALTARPPGTVGACVSPEGGGGGGGGDDAPVVPKSWVQKRSPELLRATPMPIVV
jgi:hypothetical protein